MAKIKDFLKKIITKSFNKINLSLKSQMKCVNFKVLIFSN